MVAAAGGGREFSGSKDLHESTGETGQNYSGGLLLSVPPGGAVELAACELVDTREISRGYADFPRFFMASGCEAWGYF